jgi:hypothetical protein
LFQQSFGSFDISRFSGRLLTESSDSFACGIEIMSTLKSTLRAGAILSATVLLGSTSALAQRPTTIDTTGVGALMERSASHAVYVDRAAVQRPGPNNSDDTVEEAAGPAVAHALGCLIAGSVGTGIAALAGTNNVVNVMAGGQAIAASQLALYTAVAGVIFGTFCAVGQALTPLYLHVARSAPSTPAPKPPRPVEHKAHFILEERAAADAIGDSTVGLSSRDIDMSVPASWVQRKP